MAKNEIEFSANQREKLSKLLCNAHSISTEAACFEDATYARQLKMEAEYLIANGVTFATDNNVGSKWIPVTERLPEIPEGWAESPEPVLYMMKNTKTIYAGYYGEGGAWRDKYFRQYADRRNGVDADDVLCWMYQHDLPQPPKGE